MNTNQLDVYVPAAEAGLNIDPGSGIVGTALDSGAILLDYEGNRYGAAGMEIYANRVLHAASRHCERYPTIARMAAPRGSVRRIATYDSGTGHVDLTGSDYSPQETLRILSSWLNIRPDRVPDQLWTTSYRHLVARGQAL